MLDLYNPLNLYNQFNPLSPFYHFRTDTPQDFLHHHASQESTPSAVDPSIINPPGTNPFENRDFGSSGDTFRQDQTADSSGGTGNQMRPEDLSGGTSINMPGGDLSGGAGSELAKGELEKEGGFGELKHEETPFGSADEHKDVPAFGSKDETKAY